MSTIALTPFDTLRYVKKPKVADVPEARAEAQAEALRETSGSALSGHAVQLATRGSLALVHKERDAEITLLESKIALSRRDTIWLGGMLMAGFGTVIGLLRFG